MLVSKSKPSTVRPLYGFQYYIRTRRHQVSLAIRALVTMFMAALPLVANLLLYLWKTDILKDEGLSEIVETVTQVPNLSHTKLGLQIIFQKMIIQKGNCKPPFYF